MAGSLSIFEILYKALSNTCVEKSCQFCCKTHHVVETIQESIHVDFQESILEDVKYMYFDILNIFYERSKAKSPEFRWLPFQTIKICHRMYAGIARYISLTFIIHSHRNPLSNQLESAVRLWMSQALRHQVSTEFDADLCQLRIPVPNRFPTYLLRYLFLERTNFAKFASHLAVQ